MLHTDKWILFHYFSNCIFFSETLGFGGAENPPSYSSVWYILKWCIQICVE